MSNMKPQTTINVMEVWPQQVACRQEIQSALLVELHLVKQSKASKLIICRCPLLPWEHYYTSFSFQKYRMSESEDHLLLFDLVMKMLAYDPVERVNLDEALRHPFFDNIPPQYRLEFRWIGKHKKHDGDDHPVFFFIQHGILKQKENRNKLLPTFHFFPSFLSKETVH